MIISVHIPKTAGTTFEAHLERLSGGRILRDYGRTTMHVSRLFEESFSDLGQVLDTGYFRLKLISLGIEALKSRLAQEGIGAIHGHFDVTKYSGVFPEATFVTWMREPYERALSHFFFYRRGMDPLGDRINHLVYTGQMSFADFMEEPEMVNHQYRMMDGSLERFDFVGVVERFDSCLKRLCALVGSPEPLAVDSQNTNPRQGEYREFSDDLALRRRFQSLNAQEYRLYEPLRGEYE